MQVNPRRALASERVEIDAGNLAGLANQVAGPEMPVIVGILEREDAQQKGDARKSAIRQASMTRSPQDGRSAEPISRPGRNRAVSDLGRGSGGLIVDMNTLL